LQKRHTVPFTMAKEVVTNYYVHYVPSVPAAVATGSIFAVITSLHLFFFLKSRPRRRFTIAFILGGICQ
jgi:hypothetical protein